jgi:hypothetical protein
MRGYGAYLAAVVTLAPSRAAAAQLIPQTPRAWGQFMAHAMFATGILVGIVFAARSSWRKRRRQAEEAAQASGEPVDPSWRYRITATWSWFVSVLAIGITVFGASSKGGLPENLLACALLLSGPFLALYAITGARGSAQKKVLLPAIVGALIPLFLICAAAAQLMYRDHPRPAERPPAPAPASDD